LVLLFSDGKKEDRFQVVLFDSGGMPMINVARPIFQLTHIQIPKDHPLESVSSMLAHQDVPDAPAI
jgi:hypothetical protein